MRSLSIHALGFYVMLLAAPASAQITVTDHGPDDHLIFEAADLEWEEGPASFESGATFVVLEGNPSEPGVFTMRITMPDGFVIAPHWHPNVERVTVLSGTFNLGSGEQLDPQATERLPEGSYFALPPATPHFAIVEGETVIQLTSVGPWEITYVNAEEDPRRSN